MQIHEITSRRTDEGILKGMKTLAAGAANTVAGAVDKVGRVASGVTTYAANSLSRSMGGGAIGDTHETPAGTAQSTAAEISKPVIDKLAKQNSALWANSVAGLIDKTQMPGGAKATSINNVPEAELNATFDNMTGKLLTNLSGYQMSDISQLKDKIDPNASSYIVKQVNDMITRAEQLKTKILNTEPNKSAGLWNQYVTYLGNAANMARFQGGTGAGKSIDPGSIPARVKNAGLTAQQLGIPAGTIVPNYGNQAINNLLTSIGVKVQS
jgi:hypothetical protein